MNYSSTFEFADRVVLVTGGARGIGYETARAFRECGATVALVDINAVFYRRRGFRMSNEEWRTTWLNLTPMGRVREPSGAAAAVLFLASDASTYCTGTNLVLDGGYTCW